MQSQKKKKIEKRIRRKRKKKNAFQITFQEVLELSSLQYASNQNPKKLQY